MPIRWSWGLLDLFDVNGARIWEGIVMEGITIIYCYGMATKVATKVTIRDMYSVWMSRISRI